MPADLQRTPDEMEFSPAIYKLLAFSLDHHSGLFRTDYNLRPESKSGSDAGESSDPGYGFGNGSSDLGHRADQTALALDQIDLALRVARLTARTPRWRTIHPGFEK